MKVNMTRNALKHARHSDLEGADTLESAKAAVQVKAEDV